MRRSLQNFLRVSLAMLVLHPPFPVQELQAEPKPGSGQRPRIPLRGNAQEKRIHLRFVGRTWDDVLQSVALENEQTLVMPEIPSGRLTRYDHSAHTIDEALRIINNELTSTGYQVMSRGDYLIVLKDDRFRPEYSRKQLPKSTPATVESTGVNSTVVSSAGQQTAGAQSTEVHSPGRAALAPAEMPATGEWQSAAQPRLIQAASEQPASRQMSTYTILPAAAGENSATEATTHTQPEPRPVQKPEKPAAASALVIETTHITSTELARKVYEAYGERAKLIQKGPLGLPAVQVSLAGTEKRKPVEFMIGIDQPQNQIVLVAEEQHQDELLSLFEALDTTGTRTATGKLQSPPTLLFASHEIHAATAKQLPKILAQVAQAPQETPPRGGQRPENLFEPPSDFMPPPRVVVPPAPANGASADAAAAEGAMSPADLNAILDRLRGDVNIEALNDLGLLILRGNESDVEGVMQIIKAIETMSAGTTPEIHLRRLEYVNSEALTTLLNSVFESVQGIDRRASRANRRVNLLAVVQPNAVLIIAPSNDLESALQLIDELDQPTNPNQEVKIFRLKNATATGALATLQEFYAERGGLGTRLRVSADTRTNTLIVHATPSDLKEIERVIHNIDQDESHAVSRVQLFPLKNAVAEELAEFLNTALEEALNPRTSTQFGAQQQQQNGMTQTKSFVLEFLAGSGTQSELIRSGILADIRISADARSNSLAVIAPQKSMPLLKALIEALDKPSDAVAEVKVFSLTHADATAALTLLQELFDQTGTDSPVGSNLAGTSDAGSSLLPIRFSVDVRSNSLLAIGGRDALTIVEAILLRLDNEAPRKRINTVLRLQNSPATEVATAINQFLESQRALAEIDPLLVSAVETLDREVIVVPETLSNNLLISATPQYYSEIVRIAQELDAAPTQVVIQALLVEVQLDNLDEFGVELGFQDSILFNRSLINNLQTITNTTTNQNIQTTTQQIISQEGQPGFLFNNPSLFPNLGNNVGPNSRPGVVAPQGLSNFGVGRVNGDLGFGGLVLSASSESVSVLIRALAQQRNVQVLSRPQIRTVDKQLAQIQVGQRVPIVNGVNITGTGTTSPNIEYDESGIILSVTPRINPDGHIVMEVVAERSAYRAEGIPIFTDAVTGNTITSPVKDISVARATVGVTDGQTIVLGGMISETDSATTRKVPWLGDIPVVGRLFRYDSATNVRSELLIFLTPRILGNDLDNEMIKEVEAGRIHFFREEAEEIHGPLFGVPAAEEFLIDPYQLDQPSEEWGEPIQVHPTPLLEGEQLPLPTPSGPRLPEVPPALDEDGIPTTIVPEGSLKPTPPKKGASENSPPKLKSSGVSRVFR